jgi:regulatory protein RepA
VPDADFEFRDAEDLRERHSDRNKRSALWALPAPISDAEFDAAHIAPPCIVSDYLFADVAVLVAPGGTGKTTLMLYESIHVVLGRPLFGLPIRKRGPVLILTAEDTREVLVARMRTIADAMELTPGERATIRRDIRLSDVSGEALKLTLVAGDVVVPSHVVDDIIDQALSIGPVLVNVDPAVSFGVGEARVNDAEQGLVEAARRIRRGLGCCVRYVHHSGKGNARDKALDQYAGRGGSALPDGARMVAVLQPMTADEWARETGMSLTSGEQGMVLARPKLSYAAPQPDILISRKGYAFAYTSRFERDPAIERKAACDQVLRAIEAGIEAGTLHTQRSLEALKLMTRAELRDAVSLLIARGAIEHARVPERHKGGSQTYLRPIAGAGHMTGTD